MQLRHRKVRRGSQNVPRPATAPESSIATTDFSVIAWTVSTPDKCRKSLSLNFERKIPLSPAKPLGLGMS